MAAKRNSSHVLESTNEMSRAAGRSRPPPCLQMQNTEATVVAGHGSLDPRWNGCCRSRAGDVQGPSTRTGRAIAGGMDQLQGSKAAPQLRGQVVILHFWNFWCVSTDQHNYPTLKAWHKAFAKKGVTMIGVHTPETPPERRFQNVSETRREERPELSDRRRYGCQNLEDLGESDVALDLPHRQERFVAIAGMANSIGREPRGAAVMRKKIEQLLAEPASRE